MKLKNLLQKAWLTMAFLGVLSLPSFGQSTLKHSYDFEDGTASDVVGTADGTLIGGSIADGVYTADAAGEYITLPAADIAINTYSAVTLEAYIYSDINNAGYTMLAYFGETVGDLGANYVFLTSDRNTESYAGISCGNTTEPWSVENGTSGTEAAVGAKHHYAFRLNGTALSLYVDGGFISEVELTGDNAVASLSNSLAYLCRGGYVNDPTWQGSIHKFNIYDGMLEEATIKLNAGNFIYGEGAYTNANIDTIITSYGTITPNIDPETATYEVYVPYGTTQLNVEATSEIANADIAIFDGLGNEIGDDGLTTFTGDGDDIEIIITALDGSTENSYFLSIFVEDKAKSATLSGIDFSVGDLTDSFDVNTHEYYGYLPLGTTSVDVTGIPAWSGSTVTGGGTIDVADGMDTVIFSVTSEDGNATQDYTLYLYVNKIADGNFYYIKNEKEGSTVIGHAGAAGDVPRLFSPLKGEETQLFELIPAGEASNQYYLKNKAGFYLAISSGNHWDYQFLSELTTPEPDTCIFIVDQFEPNRFTIKALLKEDWKHMGCNDNSVAGSGIYNDKNIDQFGVWNILPPNEVVDPYDTYLSTLTVDEVDLHPAFDLLQYEYHVMLPNGVTSLTVGAEARDATSTVSGTGAKDVSDENGSIVVTVTGADPSWTSDYTIYYHTNTALELKHSYTFADGTAEDVIAGADGEVMGGDITKGVYSTMLNGQYISLPGEEIAINEYPSITVEAYVRDEDSLFNGDNTMLTYFGGNASGYGNSYFFTSLKSRTAVSCLNASAPWDAETGTDGGVFIDDSLAHHVVSVLNYDSVRFYIDGALVGSELMSAGNVIGHLSNAFAYLCKSGYDSDPSWLGHIYEYNIYVGEMDEATIAANALNFPMDDQTTDATLSDLTVDGTTIEGFASYDLTYEVAVPIGTTTVPTLLATPKYAGGTAVVTSASAVPGESTILVTAEDGTTKNTYTISFVFESSDDATLADLTVDGTTIDNFDAATLAYTVSLPVGTTTVPTIDATPAFAEASIVVTPATVIPGQTTVEVTAQDGTTKMTYTVSFETNASDDATLSDLTVDGTTIDNFDAATISYLVSVPQGTTTIPTIVGTPTHSGAEAVVTAATTIPGTTTVAVTAEDGETKVTYSINIDFETGIDAVNKTIAKVYPLVSNGSFTVETSANAGTITVYDVTGKVILTKKLESNLETINLPQAGMYIMNVEANGFSNTFKVFKTK